MGLIPTLPSMAWVPPPKPYLTNSFHVLVGTTLSMPPPSGPGAYPSAMIHLLSGCDFESGQSQLVDSQSPG